MLEFTSRQHEALAGACALARVTESKPYLQPDFGAMKKLMQTPVMFDGRNQHDLRQARVAGFEHFGFGR